MLNVSAKRLVERDASAEEADTRMPLTVIKKTLSFVLHNRVSAYTRAANVCIFNAVSKKEFCLRGLVFFPPRISI